MRENQALRERLSRLSEASLRINESLDPDTVLQEVMDNARTLTGARFGSITTLDDEGGLLDFITSGLSPEEREEMLALTEGPRLFEYFSSVQGPLRLRNAADHMRALGFPEGHPPVRSLMGTPMRHQGERVGNLYVAEKEGGGEFTPEDEETLVMFASQAALVIVNARRHRDERRARADLETLINTSPVGVVVFDARTGAPVSLNRETRRILGDLRTPGGSVEQLLEVLTFRRADGREIALDQFPLAQALSTGETVRAEEIVIQVPDGRSVTTLVNATPIRSEEGEVESVVVTLQDMTPLEELERLRAEFLGMVSHELRTPLTSVKGSVTTLLDPSAALNPAETLQFHRIIDAQTDRMRKLISDLLDAASIETGTLSVVPTPVELAALVDEARNAFLSGGGRHTLHIDLAPDLPWVVADRLRIVQVLGNLLANAARHSPEDSAIRLSAVREGVHVAVSVADDGRGVAADLLPHLFRKFSRIDGDDRKKRHCRVGPGPGHLQGNRGGPRGPDPGRERRARPGSAVHPHPSGGRRGRERHGDRTRPALRPFAGVGNGAGAHPCGGRRPPGAQVRPRRALQGRLHPGCDHRPGGGAAPPGGGEAPFGAAGPHAAGERRDRADEGHPGDGRRAGHLPVRLRPGAAHRPGLRHGSRRLRGQALLADGAGGPDPGGPAQAGVARAVGALRAGRPGHRLRPTPGDPRRKSGPADRHRVPDAGRACGKRRSPIELRASAATGLGSE